MQSRILSRKKLPNLLTREDLKFTGFILMKWRYYNTTLNWTSFVTKCTSWKLLPGKWDWVYNWNHKKPHWRCQRKVFHCWSRRISTRFAKIFETSWSRFREHILLLFWTTQIKEKNFNNLVDSTSIRRDIHGNHYIN